MYTREINGKLYDFNFGLGFVRDVDGSMTIVDENKKTQKVGLSYAIAGLIDGDFEKLIDCLLAANKYSPNDKITRKEIEAWMESEDFDLEKECEDLLDFFAQSNFTKKKTQDLLTKAAKIEELEEAQYQAQIARLGKN